MMREGSKVRRAEKRRRAEGGVLSGRRATTEKLPGALPLRRATDGGRRKTGGVRGRQRAGGGGAAPAVTARTAATEPRAKSKRQGAAGGADGT